MEGNGVLTGTWKFFTKIFIFTVFVITLSFTFNRIRVAKPDGTLEIVQVAPSASNEEEEYQREMVTC